MTLKFDGWPRQNKRAALLYNIKFCAHYFKAIGKFKLELQSGNAQFWANLAITFVPCDLEISRMTFTIIRASLLFYFRLCALFLSHHNRHFVSRATYRFGGWPWKTIGYLFYATSSIKLELQSGNAVFGSKSMGFFFLCDLGSWQVTLTNKRARLLWLFKLYASFHSHRLIQTGVTVRKRPIWVKIGDFLSYVTLEFLGCPWRNDRAPLLTYFKLCA